MKVGVGLEQHVTFLDGCPAADGRAINTETFFEGRLRQLLDGIGNVVPQAGNVGEAQVENLGVVLLGEFENGLYFGIGGSHENTLPGSDSLQRLGERLRRLPQAAGCYNRRVERNRQSLKPVPVAGNSIVFIGAITRLYTEAASSQLPANRRKSDGDLRGIALADS